MRHGILKRLTLLLSVILMVSFLAVAEDTVSVGADSIAENSEISIENIDGGLELEDGQYNGDDDIALLDEIELENEGDLLSVDLDLDPDGTEPEEGNEEGIAENAQKGLPTVLKLGVKQKYTIKASDFGKGKKLTYTSSKAAVASVSKKGVITAVKKGTATITVKDGKKKLATCKVTVVAAPTKVSFSKKTYSVDVNKKITIAPVITKGSCASFAWSVKDKKIATVTNAGVVTGKKAGKTTLTVKTHNGKQATCTITVEDGVTAMSWEGFAGATADIIKKAKTTVSVADAEGEYATGRLIAKVTGTLPDLSKFNVVAIARDSNDHYLIQLSSDTEAEACAKYLAGFSNVEYVEPDQSVVSGSYSTMASRTSFMSWGVSGTHADAYADDLKSRNKTSAVKVAVVDTGVDSTHKFLKGRVKSGYDFIDNDKKPSDGNGHGTHVSGTIVDCTPGLNVQIIPVRVLGNDGSGTTLTVGEGVRFAADHGADVINLSLGGGHSNYLDECIQYAIKHNVTVVVAAGNEHANTRYACPAHIAKCITVSAVDQSKERAYFSNYGEAVDIAAPGVGIKSCIPGNKYATWNGTSMATPHVAAAAAMILLDNPGLSPNQVESKLRSAATDIGASGWDEYYGAGYLNLNPFVQSKPKQFTVAYNANGGSGAPANQTKTEGISLTLSSAVPVKSCTVTIDHGTGYTESRSIPATFTGWNTQPNGSGTAYARGGSYTADANVTLYAQWQHGVLGALPNITRAGYTFAGWYTAASGGSAVTASTVVTSNMTVYAHWNVEKKQFTVSYNANGGSDAPASQTKTEGTPLTLSGATPTKSCTVTFDYGTGTTETRNIPATFKGWNTQANGSGTAYAAGGSYSADANVTLYAQWQYGTIGTLPTPSNTGYTFTGWYTASTGGNAISSSTVVSTDMTIYAHWSQNAVSDWVEQSQVPANATIVESKIQYRYSDLTYSSWSGWSDWTVDRQSTDDLKMEESATVWYWYRFVCPYCGTHMHVWDKCYTWAGGCGNKIGSDHAQVTWLTTGPSGGVQNWEGTGRIMLGNSSKDRWFFWKDASQGYPNGRSATGYRYATRTKSWGSWSGWSDSSVSASDTRRVETRTMCRYRMN